MKWTGLNDLREAFLSFYEDRGHTRLPSFSLVPQGDNSLLLINSGMAPMKKFFMGEATPPNQRVTTCQKCIRNNDIENVGHTSRHLTYFEMLGNFSFGDYFKPQAIAWAWSFFHETLEIPKESLHISVYQEDDEAYDIWVKVIGIEPSHMVRLGKADNYWEHGTGPCGPCSEIYFDRGIENGCDSDNCKPGCDCDRFVEVGNIVFSQFDSDGKGNYTPLEKPNIDFGMGLERLACVIQGVDNVFEIDTMRNIRAAVEEIAKQGKEKLTKPNPTQEVALKIITDHIRSIAFMIGDGVLGANEGRGYVLRRLVRRAARYGQQLGIRTTFLADVAKVVISENSKAYPELFERQDMILNVIRHEEESFVRTIDQGLERLNRMIDQVEKNVLSGHNAFLLNDTFGFPLELTREILAEHDIRVDEKTYHRLMQEQRERARNARKSAGVDAWAEAADIAAGLPETVFTGYEFIETNAVILGLIKGSECAERVVKGEKATFVLDQTCFYAESGGQVADTGYLTFENASVRIVNVTKSPAGVYLHHGVVERGEMQIGCAVEATIDSERRVAIMRNHTAAHLLQAILREMLGDHVEQAGQLVDENRVRFDFTHFSALDPDEIHQVEEKVNAAILEALPVITKEMPIDEAKKLGATALFGEKYGDTVRVVMVDKLSKEFCGGTHVDNTAKLGLFKLISETSVAAGIRRIEGLTGTGFLSFIQHREALVRHTANAIRSTALVDLPDKILQLLSDLREANREIERLNGRLAHSNIAELLNRAADVNGISVIHAKIPEAGADELKVICDAFKDRSFAIAAVLAGNKDGKVSLIAGANAAAQSKGVKAGDLVRSVAQITGGKGGGRPDMAMAGVKEVEKLDDALNQVPDLVRTLSEN